MLRNGPIYSALGTAVLTLLTGCSVGPDYVKPIPVAPDAYKELAGWKVAQPKDDILRGAWWQIYGDPQLNALEEQVTLSNQNIALAEAQYRQARSLVQQARSVTYRNYLGGSYPALIRGVRPGRTRSNRSLMRSRYRYITGVV